MAQRVSNTSFATVRTPDRPGTPPAWAGFTKSCRSRTKRLPERRKRGHIHPLSRHTRPNPSPKPPHDEPPRTHSAKHARGQGVRALQGGFSAPIRSSRPRGADPWMHKHAPAKLPRPESTGILSVRTEFVLLHKVGRRAATSGAAMRKKVARGRGGGMQPRRLRQHAHDESRPFQRIEDHCVHDALRTVHVAHPRT